MISTLQLFLQAFAVSSAILLTWLVAMAVFAGWGLAFQRLIREPEINAERLLMAFWTGFALVIAFLQMWHLFFAITSITLIAFVIIGAAGLGVSSARLTAWIRCVSWKGGVLAIALILLSGLWIANRASGPCIWFDSGMYHVPVVRWINAYPAVPGLGNLHDRFAFNSSSLLYAAMMGSGPWEGRWHNVANGLLVFALFAQVIAGASTLWRRATQTRLAEAFSLFLAGPAIMIAASADVSSLATDIAPAIVCLLASGKLLDWMMRTVEERQKDFLTPSYIIAQFVLAVCLKISTIPFAFLGIALVIWRWRETLRPQWRAALRPGLLLPVLLLASLMVHGVILSGYPFYPLRIGALPVEWRVPSELADAHREWVLVSARGNLLPGLQWIPQWFQVHREFNGYWLLDGLVVPFLQLAGAILVVAYQVWRKKLPWPQLSSGAPVVLPMIGSLLLWFAMAPEPRFGFFLFCALAAYVSALAFTGFQNLWPNKKRVLVVAALIIGVLPLGFRAGRAWVTGRVNPQTHLPVMLMVPPGPDNGLHPMPRAQLQNFVTNSGLALLVPVNDNRCWDAPLFCTPHPAPNLVLKHTFSNRPTFVTVGRWAQLNWPNAQRTLARQWRQRHLSSEGPR